MIEDNKFPLWQHATILALNFFGCSGAFMVLFGYVIMINNHSELFGNLPVEKNILMTLNNIFSFIGSLFCLAGVIGTCIVAYIKPHSRLIDEFSYKISIPVIISFALLSLFLLLIEGDKFPNIIILGFAILATAGAMLRAIPFSEAVPSTWGSKIEWVKLKDIIEWVKLKDIK